LHEDLLRDTKRFKFHTDVYQFLKNESELISKIELNQVTQKFEDYTIDKSEFNKKEIFNNIYSYIYNYFIELSENQVSYLYGGMYLNYIELVSIDIKSILKRNNDTNINDLTITEFGDIEIQASVELKVYDEEEDWRIASTTILLTSSYWAQVKIEKKCGQNEEDFIVNDRIDKIELDNTKVKQIDSSLIEDYYNDLKSTARAEMMEAREEYYSH
jgi:hypothetical protein